MMPSSFGHAWATLEERVPDRLGGVSCFFKHQLNLELVSNGERTRPRDSLTGDAPQGVYSR